MYIFVFLWTPAMSSLTTDALPFGVIFAGFMGAMSIGSECFSFLSSTMSLRTINLTGFAAASVSFLIAYSATSNVLLVRS